MLNLVIHVYSFSTTLFLCKSNPCSNNLLILAINGYHNYHRNVDGCRDQNIDRLATPECAQCVCWWSRSMSILQTVAGTVDPLKDH